MWRRLFKIFGCCIIMTVDWDGEVRFRFLKQMSTGQLMCRKISGWILLNEDGSVSSPNSYVKYWKYI